MAIKVHYTRTELCEGETEVMCGVDYFTILPDNTVELRLNTEPGKYRVVGFIHPQRWQSVVQIEIAEQS